MPSSPQQNGQRESLLMDPGDGETLGAAALEQALGTCPQRGGWWPHVGHAGRSVLLAAPSQPRCRSATKMQMPRRQQASSALFFPF